MNKDYLLKKANESAKEIYNHKEWNQGDIELYLQNVFLEIFDDINKLKNYDKSFVPNVPQFIRSKP